MFTSDLIFTATKVPVKEMKSENITSKGTISVVAITLLTTRYLKGLVPETSIASICSVTFIDASSAPIPDPTLPAHINAVITGPISENMAQALEICYHSTPNPKLLILVGTDAISGGIFANSPALNRDFLNKYPIDLYVPGNPAHPLTFINGVLELTRGKR